MGVSEEEIRLAVKRLNNIIKNDKVNITSIIVDKDDFNVYIELENGMNLELSTSEVLYQAEEQVEENKKRMDRHDVRQAIADDYIRVMNADALEGDGTTTAFLAGQTVGDYSTAIDFDSITAVQEIFMDNDIDPSIPKVAVVGPTQVRKLMQLTENTSADYVRAQQLQQYGIAPGWLGFDWISSTRLLHPTAPGTDIDCLFMTRRAIGMNIPKDITARVAEDPSISFAWRIYCFAVMGAVRVEDEQIVRGKFLDTL